MLADIRACDDMERFEYLTKTIYRFIYQIWTEIDIRILVMMDFI